MEKEYGNEKMSFYNFSQIVKGHLEEITGREITLEQSLATNSVENYGVFYSKDRSCHVSSVLRLRDFYDCYLDSSEYEISKELLDDIVHVYIQMPKDTEFISSEVLVDKDYILEQVFIQIISHEDNAIFLETAPHRDVISGELSVIYRVRVDVSNCETFGSYRVTNQMIESVKLTEAELYDAAMKNLCNSEASLRSIVEMLGMLTECAGYEDDIPMLVAQAELGGASVLLRHDVLDEACKRFQTDQILILPSSIYEVLLLSVESSMNPGLEFLTERVREVNASVVSVQDRLSDRVFAYDRTTKQLSVAG